MSKSRFIPIIGLEVHVELKTKSKMFCGCPADHFGKEPNTQTCPVCLGLPGALPVPNRKAVEWCIMLGLALNCQIPEISKFDRKNYFYSDLPKGYQISQYDMPLAVNGSLKLKMKNEKLKIDEEKTVRIRRVHMEEDTGKLLHTKDATLIDFNRSGVPLMEIVTEPDIHSGQEAKIFLQKLQQIIRYLGISDADMEKGSMRCEPNVSVRKVKTKDISDGAQMYSSEVEELPRYKVEVKNINSFRFVERAINYEIQRQIEIFENGEQVKQETRGWSEAKSCTLPQRGKEEAQDYRYFPEPDIPPMKLSNEEIKKLRERIPELPDVKLDRFMKEYGLSEYDGSILTSSLSVANYYEECIKINEKWTRSKIATPAESGIKIKNEKFTDAKTIANWIINKRVDISKTSPSELVETLFARPTTVIPISKLEEIIKKVLLDNQKAVSDYKSGKAQALMFLVGQVIKESKGQVQPEKVRDQLIKLLV